ncbi:MAG: phosphatidylinositol kinase, partial [Gammaproteobacteria bacterium]
QESIADAAGVFVGYLMLDALVSNQDRHHANWGLVLLPEKGAFLAPSFDHASSLGRNETDSARADRLTTKDRGRSVEAYVARARSAFYATDSSTTPLTTLDALREATKIRPEAADYWLRQLADIENVSYRDIFAEVPGAEISEPAGDFAARMIEINANRILQTDI